MRRLGFTPAPADARDLPYAVAGGTPPRTSVSLEQWEPPVGNQGNSNTCVGWAISAAMQLREIRHADQDGDAAAIRRARQDQPSVKFLYYNARRVRRPRGILLDRGTYIRDALRAAQKIGVCGSKFWSWKQRTGRRPTPVAQMRAHPRQGGQYRQIVGSGDARLDQVVAALHQGQAVVFGTRVAKSLFANGGAHVVSTPKPGEKIAGGHAMLIVGYDSGSKLFRVRNSWGTKWRDGGHFWATAELVSWGRTRELSIVDGWRKVAA